MLNNAVNKGLISNNHDIESYVDNLEDIENFYVMLLSVLALPISKAHEDIVKVYNNDDLNKATGDNLDKIGLKVGVNRIGETRSESEVTFSLVSVTNVDKVIPAGTLVYSNKNIFYVTKENCVISAGNLSNKVNCYAQKAGTGQRVLKGELNKTNANIGVKVLVTNDNNSYGGSNAESDDEYRNRLLNWTKIIQRGSLDAYITYINSIDGLDDYKVVPKWDGVGTIKIIISPGNDSKRNEVYNGLKNNVCLLDEDINVVSSVDKTINIYCKCDTDLDLINPYTTNEKLDIKDRIMSNIGIYINGGYKLNGEYHKGLGIGKDFIPYKLGIFLDNEVPEIKNITFITPEDYISVSDYEKAVLGSLTVEIL